jgi:hypothetical protein
VSRKIQKLLMAYPHLEELDKYALKVMGLVEKVYPGWVGYAQVEEFEGYKYLEIKVPAPYKPTPRDLIINTYFSDLTVYFDHYHVHFGRWYQTPEEAFEQATICINRILQEDIIVAVKLRDGGMASAGGYTPHTMNEMMEADKWNYTRSWNGTYNRTYE